MQNSYVKEILLIPLRDRLCMHQRSQTAAHRTSCSAGHRRPCTWMDMAETHTGTSRAGKRYKDSKASVIQHQLVPT